MLTQFLQKCSQWGGYKLEKFVSRGRDPTLQQWEEHEEEEVAEIIFYGLAATLIPHPPAPLGRREVEESGVKLSLAKRPGRGKYVSVFVFVSHQPCLLLIGNKLNYSSHT